MAGPYSDGGTGPSASSSAGSTAVATSVAAGLAAPPAPSSDAGTVSLASSSAGVPAPARGPYAVAGRAPPVAVGADLGRQHRAGAGCSYTSSRPASRSSSSGLP